MTTTAATPRTITSVMTPAPITITPDTTYAQLLDLRSATRTGGVPVVGPEGTLLGVVSEVDESATVPSGTTARDVMTRPPAIVGPEASIAEATGLVCAGARRLFVVREGKLVGVVSGPDVFATADAEIGKRITGTVVGMLPDLDARCLRVTVRDGEVTLTGRVPWHRDVDACSRVAAEVPGVTVVVNRLDYVWDDRPRRHWPVRHRKAPTGPDGVAYR